MARTWDPIIAQARALVNAFVQNFGRPPTLRRLHYELVSDTLAVAYGYRNTIGDYKRLSELTAIGRRAGWFPRLTEGGRRVERLPTFANADELRDYIRDVCRVDRMLEQDVTIAAVVEKAGSLPFLRDWFDDYGVLCAAVGGYDSQTQIDILRDWQAYFKRPMIVLYAGDHDPSGEDIDRDFMDRLTEGGRDIEVRRVALLPEHVQQYSLVRMPFTKEDARKGQFAAKYGEVFQVELDALDVGALQTLFMDEFNALWDTDVWEEQKDKEADLLKEVLGDAA